MIGHSPILIFGLPRSGTSWFARMFDSHPWTLYRHEPDTRFLDSTLPVAPETVDMPRAAEAARAYMDGCLMRSREKQAGSPPYSRKRYRSGPAEAARRFLLYGLKGFSRFAPGMARAVPVPDLIRARDRGKVRIVWKSVVATTQLGAYARLMPDARCILIVRHPGGQIASRLRGSTSGHLPGVDLAGSDPDAWLVKAILDRPFGARHAMTWSMYERCEPWEKRALAWAIQNQAAMDGLDGLENARIVRYEDVAANPRATAEETFRFADLPWCEACATFIDRSSRAAPDGTSGYFNIYRDSSRQADEWRKHVDEATAARLIAAIARFPVGRLYGATP